MVHRRASFATSPLESPAHVDPLGFDRTAGRCAAPDVDPSLMHPVGKRDPQISQALALCATCPVRTACRAAGQTERYGIWGGETEWERDERRRAQRAATRQANKTRAGVAA